MTVIMRCVLVVLGCFTVACLPARQVAAELPPEILADRYLVKAERLMGGKDYGGALEALNKIVALQGKHNLSLPDEFHFKYAQVALLAGSFRLAFDAVKRYLEAAGQAGEFYREALELLDEAEQNLPENVVDRYLLQAEQLIAKKDYVGTRDLVNKIVALQKKHRLTLPDEFHFLYAQMALPAGSIKAAVESVNRYLAATGTAGRFHKEALALLDEAKQMMLLLELEMVVIPAGRFRMGCVSGKDCYDNEKAGALGVYPVIRIVEVRGDVRGVRSVRSGDGAQDKRRGQGQGQASGDQCVVG